MMRRYLSVVMLSVMVLMIAGCANGKENSSEPTSEDVQVLFEKRDSKIGDNSAVSAIVQHLYLRDYIQEIQLQTKKKPYGVTVTYEIPDSDETPNSPDIHEKNAAVLFSLIPNLDSVTFMFNADNSSLGGTYYRSKMGNVVKENLEDISKSEESLSQFLDS
ncbi:DUF4825 domain-containing protein [Listeria rustica]|uniref:DUF4825 domain-containing protein n=1 Tax=Listeria rustica TaxID=2713503 RepID=A0A7W1T3Z8_9LIST|nr:DUF4825 domain-containing protein [Listeria rustica]MBA3925091.1 DUF4825 domain-containing protein [Listeria rustica]